MSRFATRWGLGIVITAGIVAACATEPTFPTKQVLTPLLAKSDSFYNLCSPAGDTTQPPPGLRLPYPAERCRIQELITASQIEQACATAGAVAENLLTSGKFYVWDGPRNGSYQQLGETAIGLYTNSSGDSIYMADYVAMASWHLMGSNYQAIAETFYHEDGGHAANPQTDYFNQDPPGGLSPWHQTVYTLGTYCAQAAPYFPGANP